MIGRLRFGLAVAVIVAAVDQLAKWAIVTMVRPQGHIPVLPFLDFVLAWNRGVSFGVGNNQGPYNALLFTLLSLVISAVLVAWMAKAGSRVALLGLGLVVGGAVGNAADRLHYGAVVDFLYVHAGSFTWWPAMNLADWAISVGAAFLVFDSLFGNRDSHKNTP